MRIAVTGATGLVGWPIAQALAADGHAVIALGRRAPELAGVAHVPWRLGAAPELSGIDALIHAGFSHVPGRYRGGEGDDPVGFVRDNLDGSAMLFRAAARAGVGRVLFLSSRAVFGGWPAGTPLTEDLPPRPDTLYGAVKLAAEASLLAEPGITGSVLRATGVYGPTVPGRGHKWQDLFAAFDASETIGPRIGTEVRADDVVQAVRLLLAAPTAAASGVFHLSDIVLDRRDLLRRYARARGIERPLPAAGDPASVSVLDCARLRALGWTPGGAAALDATLGAMARA